MLLTDRIEIPTQRKYTDSGMLIVPCRIARTGVQQYTADSLGIEGGNKIIDVHREEEEVFSPSAMETFRSSPVTIGHPTNDKGEPISVTSKNSKVLQVGVLEGVPTRDEDFLSGTIIISDQVAIDTIEEGTVELSAGYTCDVIEKEGKYYQKNIRNNHIAIVDRGRAGSSCKISDEAIEANQNEEENMKDKKIEDKATEEVVDSKTVIVIDVDTLQAKLDASEANVVKLTDELQTIKDSREEEVQKAVVELTDAISLAKDFTDKDDFSGMSVQEIKNFVVTDALGLDLTDKSDAYVQARLDIMVEDKAKTTKLGEAMKPDVKVEDTGVDVDVDPVSAARTRMIERNK